MADEDEADGDLTDVAMDEALMLNQEPSPEYDVDGEQRPRISRASHLLVLSNNRTAGCINCLSQHCLLLYQVGGVYTTLPAQVTAGGWGGAGGWAHRYLRSVQLLCTWIECRKPHR